MGVRCLTFFGMPEKTAGEVPAMPGGQMASLVWWSGEREGEVVMPRTWQTAEVILRLGEADADEVQELVEEAGDEATETLQEWIREGNGPKSLYDAVMRFTTAPDHSFDPVDWEAVVEWIREGMEEEEEAV